MFFHICFKLNENIKNNTLFTNYHNKFKLYYHLININFNEEQINLFIKSQNIYHKLNNMILHYKLNKYNHNNSDDMYFEKININSINTIKLLIDNKIFLFTIKDIIQIINNHILHTNPNNDIISLKIRNPYTNNVIKLHNLYNIYISLRNRNIFNQIYYILYKNNFDLNILNVQYKYLLYYNLFIYNINHCSDNYLYNNIIKMFNVMSCYYNISYFLKYDDSIIVKKYKKLLLHYFIYTCKEASINTSIKNKIILMKKLFYLIEKDKIIDVIINAETITLIHSDFLNDNLLSYINNNNLYNLLINRNNHDNNNEYINDPNNNHENNNHENNNNENNNNENNNNENNNNENNNNENNNDENNNDENNNYENNNDENNNDENNNDEYSSDEYSDDNNYGNIINHNNNYKNNNKYKINNIYYLTSAFFYNLSYFIFKIVHGYIILNTFYKLIYSK